MKRSRRTERAAATGSGPACAALIAGLLLSPLRAAAQCSIAVAPHGVGTRASLDAPLVLSSLGDRLGLGWVVPARADVGARIDDSAGVELGPRTELLGRLDAESAATAGGQFEQPIHRVSLLARAGRFAVVLDQNVGGEIAQSVQCGAHHATTSETHATSRGLTIHDFPEHTQRCATVAPEAPLVLGQSGLLDARRQRQSDDAVVVGLDGSPTLETLPWRLPRANHADAPGLAPNTPMEGPQAVRAGAAGWLVVFRHRGALWSGWIGPSLTATSGLSRLGDPSWQVGLPTVAFDGREAVIAFSARARPTDPWTLRLAPVAVGAAARAASPLALGPANVFAPSVVAHAQGWTVVFSRGPLRPAGRERQSVWVQRVDRSFALQGDAVRVSDAAGGSDGRALRRGDDVAVAYLGGQRDARDVRVALLRCP